MNSNNRSRSIYTPHDKTSTVIRTSGHEPKSGRLRKKHKDVKNVHFQFDMGRAELEDQNLFNLLKATETGDEESAKRLNNWLVRKGEKAGKAVDYSTTKDNTTYRQDLKTILSRLDDENIGFIPRQYIGNNKSESYTARLLNRLFYTINENTFYHTKTRLGIMNENTTYARYLMEEYLNLHEGGNAENRRKKKEWELALARKKPSLFAKISEDPDRYNLSLTRSRLSPRPYSTYTSDYLYTKDAPDYDYEYNTETDPDYILRVAKKHLGKRTR